MHSKIFQITENKVERDDYLDEDTLTQGDGSFYEGQKGDDCLPREPCAADGHVPACGR